MPVTISGDGGISGLGGLDGYDLQTQTLVVSGDTQIGPQAAGRASLFVDAAVNSVGIGTTTPRSSALLEVADDTNPLCILNNTAGGEVRLGMSSFGFIGTQSAHPFYLRTNNAKRIGISPDTGFTSIGSAAFDADAQLHVKANDTSGVYSIFGGVYNTAGNSSARQVRIINYNNRICFEGQEAAGEGVYGSSSIGLNPIDGNVIVGTGSANAKFVVNSSTAGAATVQFIQAANSTSERCILAQSTNGNNAGIYVDDSNIRHIVNGQTDVLTFDGSFLAFHSNSSGTERMRLDDTGRLLFGHTSARQIAGRNCFIQMEGTGANTSSLSIIRNTDGNGGSAITLAKSRGTSNGAVDSVIAGDTIGQINFSGANGINATSQTGRIVTSVATEFTTTATSIPTQMRFDTCNSGQTSASSKFIIGPNNFSVGDNVSRSNTIGFRCIFDNPLDNDASVGTEFTAISNNWKLTSGNFTSVTNYSASRSTAGATITDLYAFHANANLDSGTNNYSFYSDLASGAGNWAFYAGSGAPSHFAGGFYIRNTALTKEYISGTTANAIRVFCNSLSDANTPIEIRANWRSDANANVALVFTSDTSSSDDAPDVSGKIEFDNTTTYYRTSSDYRLKENIGGVLNPVERLKKLKPCSFNFIKNKEIRQEGFIAHEVQEVVPRAVSGEKDGTQSQSLDASKLIPLLTAALQEALQRIEALESNQVN